MPWCLSFSMSKVVVLGIDGGTYTVIDRLLASGKLPHFKQLKEQGGFGTLYSTIPAASCPAWPVFYSGKNPGKIGVYYHLENEVGKYEQQLSQFYVEETLWDLVSQAGKTVCIYNIPSSFPPRTVHGYMVCGYPYPSDASYTFPASLQKELSALHDFKEIPGVPYMKKSKQKEYMFARLDKELIELRYLFDQGPYDLFVGVVMVSDVAQHFFWKEMAEQDLEYGHVIDTVYERIDEFLGYLLGKIDNDTLLFVLSDHGFGPCHGYINLNRWFVEEGHMKFQASKSSRQSNYLGNKTRDLMIDLARIAKIQGIIPQKIKASIKTTFKDVDWSRSACYTIPFGGIFVNQKDVYPQGFISSETYDSFRDSLIRQLISLKDPSGHAALKRIYKKEELYHGPFHYKMPDLIVEPADGYVIREGLPATVFTSSDISGTHYSDGILLSYGKDLSLGSLSSSSLLDIVPTLLHILEIPIPSDIDGKVLSFLFSKSSSYHRRSSRKRGVKEEKTLQEKRRIDDILSHLHV